MTRDDHQRTRSTFRVPYENPSVPLIQEAAPYALISLKKHLLILVQRGLCFLLGVPLVVIGLLFITLRQTVGSRYNEPMSRRWPTLFNLKDWLQGMLREVQKRYEPQPHGRCHGR
jgi:hypothetical protein